MGFLGHLEWVSLEETEMGVSPQEGMGRSRAGMMNYSQ